jgi:hypothetical protein
VVNNDIAITIMEQFKQRRHYERYLYVIKMGKLGNFFESDILRQYGNTLMGIKRSEMGEGRPGI